MEVRRRSTRAAALLMAAALLIPLSASGDPKPKAWNPTIIPSDFSTNVDNPYFPLPEGRKLLYRGETRDGTETLEIEVTGRTKNVMGVRTVVMIERHALNGEIVEISENWFAQHRDGSVWYFGEFSQNFEGGQPVSSEGSWEAGVGGACAERMCLPQEAHGVSLCPSVCCLDGMQMPLYYLHLGMKPHSTPRKFFCMRRLGTGGGPLLASGGWRGATRSSWQYAAYPLLRDVAP